MKVKRHNPVAEGFCAGVQIIRMLRYAKQLLSQGQAVSDVCRALEVSPATQHRWQQLYGGLQTKSAGGHELVRQNASSRKASPKEQELEQENSRLKRLLADAVLDKAMLQPLASAQQQELVAPLGAPSGATGNF